jgi:hypothetical protein
MAHARSLPESGVFSPPQQAELREHLEAICASKAFESSTTLKTLLRYLFENKNKELSEYVLAVEALGRRPETGS